MITLDLLINHPHHAQELAQWAFEEWGQFYPRATLEKTSHWVHKTSRDSGLPLFMLALDDQKLVGFAMVQRQELYREKGVTPWLGGLLVKKIYQGQGLGTLLQQWAITYANSLGHKKLYLLAFDSSLCEWYKRKGWALYKTDETRSHPLMIMEISTAIAIQNKNNERGIRHALCV